MSGALATMLDSHRELKLESCAKNRKKGGWAPGNMLEPLYQPQNAYQQALFT